MTVTEAPREAALEAAAAPSPSAPPTGLAAVVGSGDPRTIGKLFVGTSLLFLLAAGVIGVLTGVEQYDSTGSEIFGADTLPRMVTLQATGALFLGVLPLLLGLATAIVPPVGATCGASPGHHLAGLRHSVVAPPASTAGLAGCDAALYVAWSRCRGWPWRRSRWCGGDLQTGHDPAAPLFYSGARRRLGLTADAASARRRPHHTWVGLRYRRFLGAACGR